MSGLDIKKKVRRRYIRPRSHRRRRMRRRLSGFVLLSLVIVLACLLFDSPEATSQKEFVDTALPLPEVADIESAEISSVAVSSEAAPLEPAPPLYATVNVSVEKNDTLYSILREMKVPPDEILRLAKRSKDVYDLKRLKKGDNLKLTTLGDSLEKVEFRFAELEGMVVTRTPDTADGFSAERYEVPHSTEETLSHGVIDESLYQSAIRAGVKPTVIMSLSDIFAWDVDFATDIRKGDSFTILYETLYAEGRPMKTGRILAAEMVNKGKKFTAIYYEDSKGRGDYYDAKGRSLSRTLLKSPLRYSRISSHFSRKRYHPILKKYRPHHGIDYAAPIGTPVETSGDGKVIFAGWKGGYGKYIKVRHNESYTTAYGHLSRISRGIKKGARVRQGQVIGKVGKTGKVTGAHLHYEVIVRGKVVNPLSVKSKSRKTLAGSEKARYAPVRSARLSRIEGASTVLAFAEDITTSSENN